jgi:hypothetical protein
VSGYSDPERYPPDRRLTLGVQAARYGIGFLIYGLIGLVTGELLGLDSVAVVDHHHVIVSVGFALCGALLSLAWVAKS